MSNGQQLRQTKDQDILDDQGQAGNFAYFNEILDGRFAYHVKKSATGALSSLERQDIQPSTSWMMNFGGGDWWSFWTACGVLNKASLFWHTSLHEDMDGNITVNELEQ